MKRIDLALLIGLCCAILFSAFGGFAQDCAEIRDESLRLHILANSDSEADQALKLQVRDAVLTETADLFAEAGDKWQAEAAVERRLDAIEAVAEAEIRAQGYAYPVTARLVNRYFETRVYDGFTMPAGRYDAVQLEIGAGAGRNWWCVMFPPMCVPAAAEQEELPLEEQIRALGEPPEYRPAFAIVEAIESLQEMFGGEKGERELPAGA